MHRTSVSLKLRLYPLTLPAVQPGRASCPSPWIPVPKTPRAPCYLNAGKGCPNIATGVLKRHNDLRAAHGVPPLRWDAGLAAKAQAHSNM